MPDGRSAVVLSADSPELLMAEAGALAAYVDNHPSVSPDDVATMVMRTRVVRRHRALVMVADRAGLLASMHALAAGDEHSDVVRSQGAAASRTTAFVFPGQGSQYPGMGKLFYGLSPVYRREIDLANKLFVDLYGISPRDYLLGDESPEREDIRIVQPALFMQMIGLAQMWRSFGVEPMATVGHSQGEIAAAYISGVMSLTDVIHVVATRANLVVEFSPTGNSMAVVAIDRDECEALLAEHSGWAELSVVNSPHILCISGDRSTVGDMVDSLTAAGKFAKEIRVDYPAHTSIVSRFRTKLGEALDGKWENPRFLDSPIPCFGGTLGKAMSPAQPLAEYWFWNLRNRVRFDLAVDGAVRGGADTFIEIAEHPTLALAIQENIALAAPDAVVPVIGTSRRSAVDLREFTQNLAVVAVNDAGYRWESLAVADDNGVPALPLRNFPHVQMRRTPLWASHLAPGEEVRTPLPAPEPTIDSATDPMAGPRRIVETWTRLTRRTLVSPRTFLVVDHTGRCADRAAELCVAAAGHGATATMYQPDGASTRASFDSVVVLLPEGSGDDVDSAINDLAEFFGDARWLPEMGPEVAECWLVTTRGESVVPVDAAPQLFHGAAAAGFRCLAAQYPSIVFRHLDLPREEPPTAAAVVGALHVAAEPELAVRSGKVYAKRLVYADPAEPESATAQSDDLGHVVIVGGTGKLGLEFCEYFAERGAVRITLLSRSGETEAVAPRLTRIRDRFTTDVVVATCDVGDESSVLQCAADHAGTPVGVIVHAAVNYVHGDLADVTPEMVTEACRSKVLGITHVLRAIVPAPQCRVVLCSSIAATLGGRGQILYAASNRMLDIVARTLRDQDVCAESVQWGLWNVQGPLDQAGVDRVEGAGMIPMRPADALAVAFSGRPRDSVIAAADWRELHTIVSMFGHGPVIAELLAEPEPDQPITSVPAAAEPGPLEPTAPAPAIPFAELVVAELNRVMGIDSGEIDGSVPLVALGLDSLQALDFRKRVKAELDRDLPVEAILGGASLDEVVRLMDTGSQSPVGG
jgi:mycobactin polyketide synthetase MbtD